MADEKDIQVVFETGHLTGKPTTNGVIKSQQTTLKPTKTNALIPSAVVAKPMIDEEVELVMPKGHVYLMPLDANGNEYGEGFSVNHATYMKSYIRSKHSNGNPKFTIKKKL